MIKSMTDCRIIGTRRSNVGRFNKIYMIRECENCHAILEFPSDQVSTRIEYNTYIEFWKERKIEDEYIRYSISNKFSSTMDSINNCNNFFI